MAPCIKSFIPRFLPQDVNLINCTASLLTLEFAIDVTEKDDMEFSAENLLVRNEIPSFPTLTNNICVEKSLLYMQTIDPCNKKSGNNFQEKGSYARHKYKPHVLLKSESWRRELENYYCTECDYDY
jgi:hypothetical protein